MAQVAFFTFGLLHEPKAHARNREYVDQAGAIWKAADATPGYIYPLSTQLNVPGYDQRGPYVAPRWYSGTLDKDEKDVVQSLTLWDNLEQVYKFAYQGVHRSPLRRRKEWFRSGEWPSYVSWWVEDGHIPTWQQGCMQLEHLHDHGPTAQAFNFKHPFGPDGEPTRLAVSQF